MFKTMKLFRPLLLLTLLALPLSACGADSTPAAGSAAPEQQAAAESPDSQTQPEAKTAETAETEAEASGTRTYTDSADRQVEIPVSPQRIVYVGSEPGDLLALGVKPLGAPLSVIGTQVAYPDLLDGIEDIGVPYSLEKIMSLNPDLIVFNDWDEEQFASLEKIAPTVVTGKSGPTDMLDRVRTLGDIAGRTEEAETWIAGYEKKVEETKASLDLPENATASSLLLLGKTMYIMGNQGFNQTLYGRLGLKPAENVQKLIDKGDRFIDVSSELIPDYVGTEIFVLTNEADTETMETQNALLKSSVWKTIPAVEKGRVHILDSKWNFDDPITSERLLDELAKVINETE
ncbi:ABC transporter substrate-binding protein [Saccharibacillus sp. CPCC 101409]|uniref:ABC transporter substrate-binding protein n=1 Tax=Saccharibacillus sp. CPCC 101409 TaxID=3058041 RepID=UPI00267238C9|nr:ABC transporter substrate-binding protein [Saccharibacillus sp. CPCC 101409]MDO3411759.1 ABC transporter substrate-binding protein [Saccharibacillus sp. CPCC 101409]